MASRQQTERPQSTATRRDERSDAEWIACAPQEVREKFLCELDQNTIRALPYLFEFWAMPHQRVPEGDWRSWVIMGGRGAGKTRAGAEWVRSVVEGSKPGDPGKARRVALVGETIEQAREVMVFGDSGILACCPPDRKPRWHATRKMLEWPNGATAQIFSASDPDSLRGPQFDAAWVDEIGCAAIDKGTNEPNKFLDAKSSESSLPAYSDGRRDDLIQFQAIAAIMEFWADPANNPVSVVYGAEMVDASRAHVWAWDARPYPQFPNRTAVWSDGANYYRGHWLNGRASARSLAGVVAEVCADAGVPSPDLAGLYGLVRGYLVDDVATARQALQPLMLAYGADAVEEGGALVFGNRTGLEKVQIGKDDVAEPGERGAIIERTRSPEAEAITRVRVAYVEADSNFRMSQAEALHPEAVPGNDSDSNLALVLTKAEGRNIAERWLAEARLAGDAVKFALPPSRLDIAAGDVVAIDEAGETIRYRVDRVTMGAGLAAEGVRVEPGVYVPADHDDEPGQIAAFIPPAPVAAFFMDLPLISGAEVPHAPHVAIAAEPWPGDVAVYSAPSDSGYALSGLISAATVMGVTETILAPAGPGIWDRGPALKVRLAHGVLGSAAPGDVLNGANIGAIGDGKPGNWEVFQFADVVLMPDGTYEISTRLRGQAGTENLAEATWPVGSVFVLITPELRQISMDIAARGLDRHYRIGPADRPYGDPVFDHRVENVEGIGLKPYAPCHMRAAFSAGGDVDFNWIRRTREGGDSWLGIDVPLGEESESYLVRVYSGPALLREAYVGTPTWTYAAADQAADGASGALTVQVAQVSGQFGPGTFGKVIINV